MPTNLNALIRYKQIDRDLSNPFLKTTIKSLQESCSDQLAEHRGIYKLISERTIRDDIRVMRSDALGFNAPIVVSEGLYTYDVEDYSIFNIEIKKDALLTELLSILLDEMGTIENPKLYDIISKLTDLLKKDTGKTSLDSHQIYGNKSSLSVDKPSISNLSIVKDDGLGTSGVHYSLISSEDIRPKVKESLNSTMTWNSIFELI